MTSDGDDLRVLREAVTLAGLEDRAVLGQEEAYGVPDMPFVEVRDERSGRALRAWWEAEDWLWISLDGPEFEAWSDELSARPDELAVWLRCFADADYAIVKRRFRNYRFVPARGSDFRLHLGKRDTGARSETR